MIGLPHGSLELQLLGIGAMRSPRYKPAGLLVEHGGLRVVIDGGGTAVPPAAIDAWLVTDVRCELISSIRSLARERGLVAAVRRFQAPGLLIVPRPVVHTSHPTFGYCIEATLTPRRRIRVAWAPEFYAFPRWAACVDLMFAEGASFSAPIRFARGTGGHMPALEVARRAKRYGVRRLVFAHVGRSSIRAREAGAALPFGEWGADGERFVMQ